MQKNKIKLREDDDEYDFTADPKRKNYKKIKLQIKKSMIKDFYEDGVAISTLTKKYHLSYSTIAHILKVYKEKNRVFESKRSRGDREAESSIQRKSEIKESINENEGENIKVEAQTACFYPFFPQWSYIMY